jgi:hypothetical protein
VSREAPSLQAFRGFFVCIERKRAAAAFACSRDIRRRTSFLRRPIKYRRIFAPQGV